MHCNWHQGRNLVPFLLHTRPTQRKAARSQSNCSKAPRETSVSSLCEKSRIPIPLRKKKNDYTTNTYSPTNYKKPSKNGYAVSQPRPTGQIRLAEQPPLLWKLSARLFSLLHPGIRPSDLERSSRGRPALTIQVTVKVSSQAGAADTTLRQLIRDIEKIKSYDGTVVRVTLEHPRVSLFPGRQELPQVIESMLAQADAATSPHYTATPKGLPYQSRIEAAQRVFNSASPAFRREAEHRSLGAPARNRQEFFKQNPDFAARFYRSRGLETEFLRALGSTA